MLKTILKKKGQTEPKTNGKRKAIQTKSGTEAYTYKVTKREKGKKIYGFSLSPPPQFGMNHCLFRYSTDEG